eukprot:scaffold128725_cov62-Attheya_sp.AAC.2
MAGGRPSIIQNRSGHDAGDRHTGAGRPTAEESRNRATAARASLRGKPEENNKSKQSRLPMEKKRSSIGKKDKSGRKKKHSA